MNERIIVVGIVNKDDTILIGKKGKGRPPYPDVWHTLGGGVKDFEKAYELLKKNDFDASYFHQELLRELEEEANIKIKNIRNICPEYRRKPREAITKNKDGIDTHYVFLEYLCDYAMGELKAGDDIVEVRWVEKKDLKNVPLTPPSQEMYKELKWI